MAKNFNAWGDQEIAQTFFNFTKRKVKKKNCADCSVCMIMRVRRKEYFKSFSRETIERLKRHSFFGPNIAKLSAKLELHTKPYSVSNIPK